MPDTDPQPARYRQRPIEVDAIQWTGHNADALRAFAGPDFFTIDPEDRTEDPACDAQLLVEASHWVGIKPTDWVLKFEGYFIAKDDVPFRAVWEPAAPVPEAVGAEALARLLNGADVHIHDGHHPGWDSLAESGEEQYLGMARWLLKWLHVTARTAAAPAAVPSAPADRAAVRDHCRDNPLLTAQIGYPVRCPHCPTDAEPVPATHWIKHVQRHHPGAPASTAPLAVDLPARLEATLTERFTELGNPFSAMHRQEKGPDGWPASHPVGPHHVAEVLRELMAAAPASGPSRMADEATAEHHTVDGVRHLCHTGDHYCPNASGPGRMADEAQQPETQAECDCPNEGAVEHQFGVEDCTCIPFVREGGTARYCQPGDTVDQISGWERGGDCPHHRKPAAVSQPGKEPTQ